MLEGEEVYVLKECPPAQSIGKTVMDKGYMFIWDPREQVPYMIPPTLIDRCKINVPRKHRICATRVVEYVPQYDEEVNPVHFVPPERVQPLEAIRAAPAGTTSVETADDDAVSIEDVLREFEPAHAGEASPSARPSGSAAPGAEEAIVPTAPPHPDDDKTLLELVASDIEGSDFEMKRAAFEEPHILTHFPKNPFCPVCRIAKDTAMRVSHKPDAKSDDLIDPPQGPFEQLATDDVIMAKGWDSVGIGLGGVKSFHVIRDTYSGTRIAYPMTKRDASSHARNFRHFLGLKANEVATQVLVKMDEAGELEQAAHEAGIIPETSLPNRWPHNAILERDVREEKECCRSIQLQSGLPYQYHVHSYPFACLSMSFDRPAICDSSKTQWEVITRKPFEGIRKCFGQLVYYRDKRINKRTLEPNLSPGLFLGWRIDSGLRYKHVVRILDYMEYRVANKVSVVDCPEMEIYVEEGPPIFPLAAARKSHLEGGSLGVTDDLMRLSLPEYSTRELPFPPEGIEAVPPTPLEPKDRSVYITLDRLVKFGDTPGCKACEHRTRYHTKACRERFAQLVQKEKDEIAKTKPKSVLVEPPVLALGDAAEATPHAPAIEDVTDEVEGSSIVEAPADPIIAGLAITPHTAYRTALVDAYPSDGIPVFGMPSSTTPNKLSKRQKRRAKAAALARGRCMFEFACSVDSQMKQTNDKFGIPHVCLARERFDLLDSNTQAQLSSMLKNSAPRPDIWASIPCTSGSPWQRINRHKGDSSFAKRLARKVQESKHLFASFVLMANIIMGLGGDVSFEWPQGCDSWERDDVKRFFDQHQEKFYTVNFDGCSLGVKSLNGNPIKKPWRVKTTNKALAHELLKCKCTHSPDEHVPAAGNETARTAFYPEPMTEVISRCLYPEYVQAGPVPCMPVEASASLGRGEHRQKEQELRHVSALAGLDTFAMAVEADTEAHNMVESLLDLDSLIRQAFDIPQPSSTNINALVTKLLSRSEMLSNPEALKAVKAEAEGLVKAGAWDLNSVREFEDVKSEARASRVSVHFGKLMTIASIKFYELAQHLQKMKGRIVYRGDCAKDEHGAAAVYQELGANPTSVQGLNACLAYGSLQGNLCTAADAVKAYIQALLKSKYRTWIELPPELRPDWWRNKFVRPVVLLVKALYGHPDAGGLWEQHLKSILKTIKGTEVPEYPGNYYFPDSKLLLSTYVDDLTLAGPADQHAAFWERLTAAVDVEPPEPIYRILGRNHIYASLEVEPNATTTVNAAMRACPNALVFDMVDYAQQTIELYLSVAKVDSVKPAQTPFVPEGSLSDDCDEPGELAPKACSILMKALWLARLSRPDILKPINDLATRVQKWTKNEDKKLLRLIQYLQHSKNYRLVGSVDDPAEALYLELFCDADYGGDKEDVKSTSGGYLVLKGPNTTFPLAWLSKRQTSVSRSTTESEVVSLAHSVYTEGIPALQLWSLLFDRPVQLILREDNQATIIVVEKGYSPKLRHISRTHKVNLSGLSELLDDPDIKIEYVDTLEQLADIFTKALQPQKWYHALCLLGIRTDLGEQSLPPPKVPKEMSKK